MRRSQLLLALCLSGAGALALIAHRQQQAETARLRAEVAALAVNAGEAQRVAASQTLLARMMIAAPAQVAAQGTPPDAPGTQPGRPAADTGHPQRSRPDNDVSGTATQAFAREALDPAWSTQAQSIVRDRMSSILTDSSTLHALECRSSMCRMELVMKDPARSGDLMRRAFADPKTRVWKGHVFAHRVDSADGEQLTVAYLVREGLQLPSPREAE